MKLNNIIYFDTSTDYANISLFVGEKKVAEQTWEAGRRLSATLADSYAAVLKEAGIKDSDLSAIVVFLGPGSFTGLRIGISFANALAYALSIPIYGTKKRKSFDLKNPIEIALPYYGSEPKITKPKK